MSTNQITIDNTINEIGIITRMMNELKRREYRLKFRREDLNKLF